MAYSHLSMPVSLYIQLYEFLMGESCLFRCLSIASGNSEFQIFQRFVASVDFRNLSKDY